MSSYFPNPNFSRVVNMKALRGTQESENLIKQMTLSYYEKRFFVGIFI